MKHFSFQTTLQNNQKIIKGLINNDTQNPLFTMVLNEKKGFPANGGLRIMPYLSTTEADTDCLILAQSMEEKHTLYNTGFSGTKIVSNSKQPHWDKNILFQCIAQYLNELNGMAYTGCDSGTSTKDMEYLSSLTPFILSALGTHVDGSLATAYGVLGSIKACLSTIKKPKILVYGMGKVGVSLSNLLLAESNTVYSFDIISEKANVEGCINLSSQNDFLDKTYDLIAFCSTQDPLTKQNAASINAHYILGSTNGLFQKPDVFQCLSQKKITCIPSYISSAGAVICDSIEKYQPIIFKQAIPQEIYFFVENTILQKTKKILEWMSFAQINTLFSVANLPQELIQRAPIAPFCGQNFRTTNFLSLKHEQEAKQGMG